MRVDLRKLRYATSLTRAEHKALLTEELALERRMNKLLFKVSKLRLKRGAVQDLLMRCSTTGTYVSYGDNHKP